MHPAWSIARNADGMVARCKADALEADTYANETVLGLELHRVARVVDKGETSGASTTEGGSHTENDALLLGGLVHLGELLGELSLGDVGTGRVNDIENHLLPLEQTVGDELASSEGDGRSGVLWSGQQRHCTRCE